MCFDPVCVIFVHIPKMLDYSIEENRIRTHLRPRSNDSSFKILCCWNAIEKAEDKSHGKTKGKESHGRLLSR